MRAIGSYVMRILPRNVRASRTILLKWAIAGYVIRLAVMPLLGNVDQMTTAWVSLTLVRHQQMILSNDPPLVFYVHGGFFALVYPILPTTVVDFLTSTSSAYTPALSLQQYSLYLPRIQIFLFVSKIPNLIFDFATATLLLHLFEEEKKSLLAFKLWMLNPFSIFISYFIGQFDIMPVFFLTLAMYFFKKKKEEQTMLALGISAAFKMFTMLFALPIALIYLRDYKGPAAKIKRLVLLSSITLFPFVATMLASVPIPVYYESANAATASYSSGFDFNGFFGRDIYNRGKPGQPLLAGLFFFTLDYSASLRTLTSFYDVIYFFPLLYSLFMLGVVYHQKWTFDELWRAILVFLLVYYSVTLFHMQWFLWAQPLLILLLVEQTHRFWKLYVALLPLYMTYSLYWNPGLISFMNSIGLPGLQVINFFRAMLSGVCIFIAFLVFKEGFGRAD